MAREVNPQDWTRIEQLFAELVDLTVPEQQDHLARTCADDAEVRAQVERLLRAHADVGGFLEELDADRASALIDSSDAEVIDLRLGPYRVMREIGRGGMGAVYLAERADGSFDQRVALKRVKRGLDTELILQRFLHERRILARLEHPNIARLIDGGSDAEGRPYFAMEYVDGLPITRYCQHGDVPLRERLRLFLAVCEAVRHAHRNLVVHRDLKPSNILVTSEGSVKLLDFGIARLLDTDANDGPQLTQFGLRLLTPDYAAPEQIRGGTITTATDVYALGVLLYELLTDARPFGGEELSASEIETRVCETDPRPPSEVHAARRREIAGELDWIVMMALRKDADRRYPSVDALMRDVQAHLAGHAVSAGPESLGYRWGKAFARHRTRFVVTGVFVSALVAGTVLHTAEIQRERDRARAQAARAERVTGLLVSLFRGADPWLESHGRPLTARELVERGQILTQRELAGDPELEAAIAVVLGTIQRRLGNYTEADSLLTRSLALRRTLPGDHRLDVARSQHALGQLFVDRSEYEQAEGYFRHAIAAVEESGTDAAPWLASMKNDLGALLYYRGRYDEAENVLREVLATRSEREDDPDLAYTMNDLALVLIDRGDYAEAETLLTGALALHERFRGADHPDLASTANNLALAYDYQDRFDEAEQWYRRSLDAYRRTLGEQHPQVALIADNLGAMLSVKKDWEASQEMLDLALRIRREIFGEQSLAYAETLNNLGHLWLFAGDLERAEPALREAIPVMRAHVEQTLPLTAAIYALGEVMNRSGRTTEAEAQYREAIRSWTALLGPDEARLLRAYRALGENLLAQGRTAEAHDALREALRLTELRMPDDAAAIVELRTRLEVTTTDREP